MRLNLSRRSILGAFGGGLALSPTGPALAQAVYFTVAGLPLTLKKA